MLRDGLSGIRGPAVSPKYHDQFCEQCRAIRVLLGAQIKPVQLVIIIYSNQAEEFDSIFLTVDISHVDGERVAFWNSHQSNDGTLYELHQLGH